MGEVGGGVVGGGLRGDEGVREVVVGEGEGEDEVSEESHCEECRIKIRVL